MLRPCRQVVEEQPVAVAGHRAEQRSPPRLALLVDETVQLDPGILVDLLQPVDADGELRSQHLAVADVAEQSGEPLELEADPLRLIEIEDGAERLQV